MITLFLFLNSLHVPYSMIYLPGSRDLCEGIAVGTITRREMWQESEIKASHVLGENRGYLLDGQCRFCFLDTGWC